MFEQLNDTVISVVRKIEHMGYRTFIAGPTVRELIMNETPVAYVLVTTASKLIINSIFRKTIINQQRNNCITVIENKTAFNIFCSTGIMGTDAISEIRRLISSFDFTINSVAYNPKDGLVDYFNAMDDINNKVISFSDNSHQAFLEKPIRLLKAFTMAALLDFEISQKSQYDIKKYSILIKKASHSRIREELDKILLSENPGIFHDMNKLSILKYVLPELDICFSVPQRNKYHIYNVGEHIIHAVSNTPNDPAIRWAALLHDIGKTTCKSVDSNGIIHFYGHHRESVRMATEILRRFKVENQLTQEILTLIENHDVRIECTPHGVKKMMTRTGLELFPKLLLLQEADNKAKNMKFFNDKLNRINEVRRIYHKVVAERHPYRISDLALNSRDLSRLGFRAGREISDTLQKLLDEVLIDPALNTSEYLIVRAKQLKRKSN